MSHDPLSSVYKIEGIYADPYDIIKVIKSASKEQKQEIIDAVKKGRFDTNPNIRKEVQKFEHLRDMSS
jgi:phage terminase small subunit